MKNLILVLAFTGFGLAQWQAPKYHETKHQHLGKGALLLAMDYVAGLKALTEYEIGDMDEFALYLGTNASAMGDSSPSTPISGTLLGGLFDEDYSDIIYLFEDATIFGEASLTSITHFWSADAGDLNQNTFDLPWYVGDVTAPNAFVKAQHYVTGGFWFNIAEGPKLYRVRYQNLFDAYRYNTAIEVLSSLMISPFEITTYPAETTLDDLGLSVETENGF